MPKSLFAFAIVAASLALVLPAGATTFPGLTTIYVGSGVRDDGGADNTGLATTFMCSNVSGATASVRFLVLGSGGAIAGQGTVEVAHGRTVTVSTHLTTTFIAGSLPTGAVFQGVINIESTESAVFCTALIVDAADAGEMAPLHLVRVNPHPGTVE